MAEFNLFMGTARKSVGDITLMRRAGRQLARVRLRTISNPKTEGQAIQRNFVAPVARFYGPLKHVLKRSWEGLNTDNSYNKFLSVNVELARREQWFLPKGAPWKPLPYQLSAGSLSPLTYTISEFSTHYGMLLYDHLYNGTITTLGDLSTALMKNTIIAGDVVTIILVRQYSDGQCQPNTYQLQVNPSDSRTIASVFDSDLVITSSAGMIFFSYNDNSVIAGAILYARKFKGVWCRSSQFLAVTDNYLATLISQEAREASIASYQAPDSDEGGGVYPGGDDNLYNVAAADGRALLFIGGQYTAQVVDVSGNKIIQLKADNYDHWYYLILSYNPPLGTNAAGSTNPSDWRAISMTPTADMLANYILVAENSTMYQYLQSIGWGGF